MEFFSLLFFYGCWFAFYIEIPYNAFWWWARLNVVNTIIYILCSIKKDNLIYVIVSHQLLHAGINPNVPEKKNYKNCEIYFLFSY